MVVISGLVYANRDIKSDTSIKPIPKPLTAAERIDGRKQWEATPAGIMFKKWEASPSGIKVHNGAVKISKSIRNYSDMEGVVTSLSLPPGSRLGFGVMINIKGEDYILAFGLESNHDFEQLRSLKVNDKIIIRSRSLTKAPKYAYPIVTGHYIERDGNVLYKFIPHNGGC